MGKLKTVSILAIVGFASLLTFTFSTSGADSYTPMAIEQQSDLPQYSARFGRIRPIIAVIGENTYTEVTDYVVPYGVLSEANIADVYALATQAGPLQMMPALRIAPQATTAEFDLHFPQGADYVIVPAVHNNDDSSLLNWIRSQASKGATVVGVCDGVKVVANAGLLENRKAVAHWYSMDDLRQDFPTTQWLSNLRYVADQKVITTTGVTASIPVSLALVEAIGGRVTAAAVATRLGVEDWSNRHQSDQFKLSVRDVLTGVINWLSFWAKDDIAIPIAGGVDEIALALAADVHSRTYRSKAYSLAATKQPVISQRGLRILPDRLENQTDAYVATFSLSALPKATDALDQALLSIKQLYGEPTAAMVALQLEYQAE